MNLIPADIQDSPGYRAASPHFVQHQYAHQNPRKGVVPPALRQWSDFLTRYRREHPNLSMKQAMKGASKTYKRRNPELTFGDESLPGWDIGQTAPTGSDAIMLANPKMNWWIPGYAVAALVGLSLFQNMKR